MIRALTALGAYSCAAIGFLGAIFQFGHVWVLSWALAMAVFLIVWGLGKALTDDVEDDQEVNACVGPIVDRGVYVAPMPYGVPDEEERELPYKRPVWDNAIGAPE